MSRTFAPLARSAAILGGTTFSSRLLGFLRDVLIARAFGTGTSAQAFVVAFTIPNLFRDFIAEGAVSAAVVPTLAGYWRKGKEAFWELAALLWNQALLRLGFLTLLGVALAPILVLVYAPGFLGDPEKYRLTVFLTRLLFPFLFLVGLSAYGMGILNTLRHFFIPALGSSLLNCCMIASLLLLVPWMEPQVLGLGIGVLVGGVVQLLIQFPVLRQKGFVFNARFSSRHPGVQNVGRLLLPRVFGSAVYQLSVMIDRIFASLSMIVGEGGVAALYYSNRIVQLPFALFGVSLATAALPTLSDQAQEESLEKFRETLLFSLKSVFFTMIPAVIGTLVLARPIVRLLFERGNFDVYSTDITAQALFFYVMGLLSFSGSKILASAFYSLQDTRTPVKVAALALLVNVLFNAILMFPMKIGGIALATSISSTAHFLFLFFLLRRRIGPFGGGRLFRASLRFLGAGLLMAVCLSWISSNLLKENAPFWGLAFLGTITSGAISYLLFSLLFRFEEAKQLIRWISKKE